MAEKKDWAKGLSLDILTQIAGGHAYLRGMRGVCKAWQKGYDNAATTLRVAGNTCPPLPASPLVERFPSLTFLDLGSAPMDPSELHILEGLSNLASLTLGTSLETWQYMDPEPLAKNLTDDHFVHLRGLPLTSLDLANCRGLRGGLFKRLRGMPLSQLGLTNCEGLGDFDEMARLWGLLITSLDLQGCKGFASLEFLNGLPLTSLRVPLAWNRLDDEDQAPSGSIRKALGGQPAADLDDPEPSVFDPLAGAPLERLTVELQSTRELFGDDLEPLRGLSKLTSLTLETFGEITPGAFAALREIPKLAELSLRFDPTDDPLSSLEEMYRIPLTHLSLESSWGITDDALEALRELAPPLTSLSLGGCPKLTDAGIIPLITGLPLTSLNLARSKISDACLETLAGMPLTELDLGQCAGVSDAGLRHLAGLPLRTLSLGGCRGLTDAAVAHLRDLPLTELNLSGCRLMTDGMLKELRGMPLQMLNVATNKLVTNRALQAEGFSGETKQRQTRV